MCAYSFFNLMVGVSSAEGIIDLWRFLGGLAVGLAVVNNEIFMSE